MKTRLHIAAAVLSIVLASAQWSRADSWYMGIVVDDVTTMTISGTPVPTVEVLPTPSPDPGEWAAIATPGPFGNVHEGTMVSHGGSLFFMGGEDLDTGEESNFVWKSDDDGVEWENLGSAAWEPRAALGSASDGEFIYIFGGVDDPGVSPYLRYSDIWKSSDGLSWSEVGSDAMPFTSSGDYEVNVLFFGGNLYILPCERAKPAGGVEWLPKVYRSLDSGLTWSEICADVGDDRYYYGAVADSSYMYMIGGIVGSTEQTTILRSADGITWSSIDTLPDTFGYCAAWQSTSLWAYDSSRAYSGEADSTVWSSDNGDTWNSIGSAYGPDILNVSIPKAVASDGALIGMGPNDDFSNVCVYRFSSLWLNDTTYTPTTQVVGSWRMRTVRYPTTTDDWASTNTWNMRTVRGR